MTTYELGVARGDFLAETLNYYKTDPTRRAVTRSVRGVMLSCEYKQASTGNMCAIGRHIPSDRYCPSIEGDSVDSHIMEMLPVNVQVLGEAFLFSVQVLHDSDGYWSATGLTEQGEKWVKSITTEHNVVMPVTLKQETIGDPPAYIEDWIEQNVDLVLV